jgi:DNA-binding transcriptional regulator of glucitol operon
MTVEPIAPAGEVPPAKKGSKTWLIILIVVVLCCLCLLAVWALYTFFGPTIGDTIRQVLGK